MHNITKAFPRATFKMGRGNRFLVVLLLMGILERITSQELDHIDQVFYTDGSCSRVMRPLHSLTLKFADRDLGDGEFHVPDSDIDCYVTFTSDAYSDNLKRLVSVKGRNANHNISNPFTCQNGITPTNCLDSNSFVQVFYGGGTDNPALTLAGTYCGTSTLDYLEAPVQYRSVTVRLVVKAYTDTTTQIASTVTGNQAGSSAPAAVTSAAAGGASVSSSGGTSTAVMTSTGAQNTTTVDPTISSCGVNFSIDITSFIAGNCNQDGRKNNKDQYYCKNTDKCLSRRLKCDGYVANNCGDYSDNYVGKPSFCGKPNIAVDFLWLWILLGVLALLALLYWCCWRPGWFVWRCGFIRNCCYNTSCYKCSAKCNKCCCRSCTNAAANRSGNPCGGRSGSGADVGAGDGAGKAGTTGGRQGAGALSKRKGKGGGGGICCCLPSKVKDGGGDGGNANNGGSSEGAGGPWEDYFNGGGFHLRRHRL